MKLKAVCIICGKSFHFYTSKSKGLFCSKPCQYLGFTGKNNPRYRNGTTIGKNGYIYEQNPKHALADCKGRVLQHRRIAFDYLGFLPPNTIIHHINHNQTDNRIENLAIWFQSDHLKEHDPLSSRYGKKTEFFKKINKPIPICAYLAAMKSSS